MAKSKSKPRPLPSSAAKKPSATAPGAPRTAVEERWTEYWTRRQDLEAAVEQVRIAREALQNALLTERTLREAFDETKRTLKDLLDVAPADSTTDLGDGSVAEKLN